MTPFFSCQANSSGHHTGGSGTWGICLEGEGCGSLDLSCRPNLPAVCQCSQTVQQVLYIVQHRHESKIDSYRPNLSAVCQCSESVQLVLYSVQHSIMQKAERHANIKLEEVFQTSEHRSSITISIT
jgi:hypothetical protein